MNALSGSKILTFLRREFWQRHLPHGLISWRYLWPGQSRQVRLHRHFWWHAPTALPRPLWLIQQSWLYLRWIVWLGWRASWRTVKQHGPAVQAATGLSQFAQWRYALRLALGRCLPPRMIYQYQLYLPQRQPWDYVSEHETGAFHRWRDACQLPASAPANKPLNKQSNKQASREMLADKWQCSQTLASAGIAVATTYCMLPRNSPAPDWDRFALPLFLKPRYGSAGQDCFYVYAGKNGAADWQVYGQPASARLSPRQQWQRASRQQDYLIQPCVANASALATLASVAITLRVLTKRSEDNVVVDFACLEIPLQAQQHRMQPIDLASGALLASGVSGPTDSALATVWQHAALANLPHWQQALRSAMLAHQMLAGDLYSVAWDFVLSEAGALLLEGNSSWRLHALQAERGGLLNENRK
ncbi:MAG: sugar-transfer associated ATP-grasp domain-containing protein [Undibacterium sp.]|uniref:sugar-transfer associated ATP-grasp domain-containing protein n=1 Tax=Undibacterium sp. TaxID=1914977 RepID=UPI00271FDDE0|nr:sugar-transfer associated ATP-grasp domain-containing protein [Undibacterium sp.]MDO8652615.1 sugar-transfer associated ATP-grasp domain-containing protein [Undibacterium sp.]